MVQWVIFTRQLPRFVPEDRVLREKRWHDFCCIPEMKKGNGE
jgi:hypothetical protein